MRFYDREQEIIESVALNQETYVVAGNKLGKDYTGGFIAVTFFIAPWLYFPEAKFREIEARRKPGVSEWQEHTRRVVTTSVDGDQLRNLWGEIGRFISTSRIPLNDAQGGLLRVNMRDISLAAERIDTDQEPLNYLIGRVTATGEGISGAHAEYNLLMVDEASGAHDLIYTYGLGWMKKFLAFGNPNECNNFYKRNALAGDLA